MANERSSSPAFNTDPMFGAVAEESLAVPPGAGHSANTTPAFAAHAQCTAPGGGASYQDDDALGRMLREAGVRLSEGEGNLFDPVRDRLPDE